MKDSKVFCASSAEAATLDDEEFWERVYPQPTEQEVEEEWLDVIQHETWILHCARCGRHVEVEEEVRHLKERDAFCDDCAEETLEEE